MARSTRTIRSNRKDEGTAVRPVHDQPTPFLGLLLAPFVALLLIAVLHYTTAGMTIGDRQLFGGNPPARVGLIALLIAGAAAVTVCAWLFAYDRHAVWQWSLTASAAFIGAWVPFLVAVGPNFWLGLFFLISAWIVSAVWSLPRLHVLRRDPRENNTSGLPLCR